MSLRPNLAMIFTLAILPFHGPAYAQAKNEAEIIRIDTAFEACHLAKTHDEARICSAAFMASALSTANQIWSALHQSGVKIKPGQMSKEQEMHYAHNTFGLKCNAAANMPYYPGMNYEQLLSQPHWCLQFAIGMADTYNVKYDTEVAATLDARLRALRKYDLSNLR